MKKLALPFIGLIALACQSSLAQISDTLKDATQRALATNPEVTAKLNAFRAAVDETKAARGAYLPRLDLSGSTEIIRQRNNGVPANDNYSSTGLALTASQLLWDGLSTKNQVSRLDHARLVRYFEFLDASEQTALESAKAYTDVIRARNLVKLAEENYVNHRVFVEQIQSRVKAGFDRASDLEQATARLALAESNLATETSNLHDITERYRRLVGTVPPADMNLPATLDRGLPASAAALLEQSAKRNAAVAAAVENLRAAQAQSKSSESAYQPRVEARLRGAAGHNLDGVIDQKREARAGVYLNWNLFNGGADQARIRQQTNLLAQTSDTRDKVCRDIRQTASIAFNDVRKLNEQLVYLDTNAKSTSKARDAYRDQFNIGRRSLLDVLNTESDLYTARRAYVNAEMDLAVAKVRTHAASSSLVAALGLTRAGNQDEAPADALDWQAGDDAATRCPLTPTDLTLTPKSELDDRARQMQGGLPALSAAPAAPALAATPIPSLKPEPAARPATPTRADPPPSTPVSQRLLDWAGSWSEKDVTRYLSFYDAKFSTPGTTRAKWFANRTKLLKKDGPIELRISNIQRRSISSDLVEMKFDQNYVSSNFKDRTQKTLVWKRSGTDWYIIKESSR